MTAIKKRGEKTPHIFEQTDGQNVRKSRKARQTTNNKPDLSEQSSKKRKMSNLKNQDLLVLRLSLE